MGETPILNDGITIYFLQDLNPKKCQNPIL
jgi:hypothetical protein